MHIAIVVGAYWGDSGVSTHVRDLSTQLLRQRIDVSVFAPDIVSDRGMQTNGLRFFRIKDIPLVPQIIFYFLSLLRCHRKFYIDVVHVHDSIAFLSVWLFSKLCGVPTVFTFHGSIFSPYRALNYSRLDTAIFTITNRAAAVGSHRVVGVSAEMVRCAKIAGASAERIILISNFIDLSVFKADMRREQVTSTIPSRHLCCLFVGALTPVKGVEFLIQAIPQILEQCPKTNFAFVGDGPLRTNLTDIVAKFGLGEHVRFVGRLSWGEVLNWYKEADIFILPSLSDPKPIVILEALASGLPIVASNVDGIPEMIEDGVEGFLVPPGKPNQIADRVTKLLNNPVLRIEMEKNSLKRAYSYSWESNLHLFIDLYHSLKEDKLRLL